MVMILAHPVAAAKCLSRPHPGGGVGRFVRCRVAGAATFVSVSATSTRTISHHIAGEETEGTSKRTAPVYDPATGAQQAAVLLAEREDVERAVAAAAEAFAEWGETSVTRRAQVMFRFRDLLDRHADELARIIASEHGKVVEDAKGEVIRGREVVEFACGIPTVLKGGYSEQVSTDVDSFSFRQPVGVCAGITPRSEERRVGKECRSRW